MNRPTGPAICDTCREEPLEAGLLIKAKVADYSLFPADELTLAYCSPTCMAKQIRMYRDSLNRDRIWWIRGTHKCGHEEKTEITDITITYTVFDTAPTA